MRRTTCPTTVATTRENGRPTRHLRAALNLGLVLAAATLAACGSSEGASPSTSDGAARGAALYEANCAACHGVDLRGTSKGPSHLSIVYEPNHHGDDAFRSAIAVGATQHHWNFGDMAPVPGLDAQEVDDIISYIRTAQDTEGFER